MPFSQSSQKVGKPLKATLEVSNLYNVDIAYIGSQFIGDLASKLYETYKYRIDVFTDVNEYAATVQKASIKDIPGVILLEIADGETISETVSKIRNNPVTRGVILILLGRNKEEVAMTDYLLTNSSDIYFHPFDVETIARRINFLVRFKLLRPIDGFRFYEQTEAYKPSLLSRGFSFLVAFFLIILFSPILLLTALLIKLESKGPAIYKSKRAGTGYQVFDFYKFRSMVVDADKKLEALRETNNQYGANNNEKGDQAFVKILNDPRVTKIGSFIRKTSIDELPQLFNVLKGDMMLVGNRPLPLYEAEMLTSDQFAMRFLGPAGITGLWQISKRGKAEMSDIERKELDNQYAKYSSFWMDIKIMLKTIPALFQKENV